MYYKRVSNDYSRCLSEIYEWNLKIRSGHVIYLHTNDFHSDIFVQLYIIIFIHIKKYAFIERHIFGHSILYMESLLLLLNMFISTMYLIVCICIHGFDRGLPLKNDLSLLIFCNNLIHDNNKLSITCGRFFKISHQKLLHESYGKMERNDKMYRLDVVSGKLVSWFHKWLQQVESICLYTQCGIYPNFRYKVLLQNFYNYILLLFHLNFSWTLWAVNNAHASFVWEKAIKRSIFPGNIFT